MTTFRNVRRSLGPVLLALCLLGSSAGALAQAAGKPRAAQAAASTDNPTGLLVNLNTASSSELEQLPGVGPSRAQAILQMRTQMKRFSRIEDLMRVKGIGRATFRKLRPMLTVEGSAATASAAKPTGAASAASPAAANE